MRNSLAIISLGSNQGDSAQLLMRAAGELRKFSSQPIALSSLYASKPIDCPPGSADFVNAIALLEPLPRYDPLNLLLGLQELEKQFGRQQKKLLNEPRPLDLDLICFGMRTIQSSVLTVPHPRAHLRRFVLEPLSELLRNYVLPGQTQTVEELTSALKPQQPLHKLPFDSARAC